MEPADGGVGSGPLRGEKAESQGKKKTYFLKHSLAVLLKSTTDKWQHNVQGGIHKYFNVCDMAQQLLGQFVQSLVILKGFRSHGKEVSLFITGFSGIFWV